MRNPLNSFLTPAEQKILLWLCLFFTVGTGLNMAGWNMPVLSAKESSPESLAVAVQQDVEVIIDIRSATANELDLLPGIGAKRAADIIAFRTEHPFKNVNEIMNVSGIGIKTYEKMKPMLLIFGNDAPLDKNASSATSKSTIKSGTGTKDTSDRKSSASKKNLDAVVNINTASVAELCNLSGIGEVKAHAIVEYREQNGKFVSVDDLAKVKGVGPVTVEKNRARIRL